MSFSWSDLRSWNGSQQLAFEELCCQLHSTTPPVTDARFIRKGTRDAGVEGYWEVPDGSEHGLQAKFFRGTPNESQMSQIDGSVKTALSKHPQLTKYIVCLPMDRDNPRIEGQEDFMQRWDTHAAKWAKWASELNRTIEFEYCGESELCRLLATEVNAGLERFWFGKDEFSLSWFVRRKEESIAPLRDSRYLPNLHVDITDLDRCIEGLTHDHTFFADVASKHSRLLKEVGTARSTVSRVGDPELNAAFDSFVDATNTLASIVERIPVDMKADQISSRHRQDVLEGIQIRLRQDTGAGLAKLETRLEALQYGDEARTLTEVQQKRIRELESKLRAVGGAHSHFQNALSDESTQAAAGAFLLLDGEAGIGKSHYLARVVDGRVERGLPTLLFLGEQFKNEPILAQIRNRLGIGGSNEEFLGALSSVARSCRCRALIAIDALNEADDKRFWKTELPSFLETLSNYPDICLVLSIRSTYANYCLPTNLDNWQVQRVDHPGFSGREDEAFLRYFSHFGISPTYPVLQPEFTNPLFLKIFCEAVSSKPDDAAAAQSSLSSLLTLYLASVNERLAEEVFETDPREQFVQRAVQSLADRMVSEKRRAVGRQAAKDIIDSIHSEPDFQKSLYRHLLHEGIITEMVNYAGSANDDDEHVRFSYERFGEFWLAESFLRSVPANDDVATRDKVKKLFQAVAGDEQSRNRNASLVESLLILVAESYGLEITELDADVISSSSLTHAVLGSIVWRSSNAVTEQTENFIRKCLAEDRHRFAAFDCLLRVATRSHHRLNAVWLHSWLMNQSMPDRDATWSIYLHSQWQYHSSLRRIVEWAWNENSKKNCIAEVRHLCGMCLSWFFTSSNRFLRDRSTKALVALYDDSVGEFREVIAKFSDVDDLYVTERVLATACGLAMRSDDTDSVASVADVVFDQIFAEGTPPAHILVREYARLIIERAAFLRKDSHFDMTKIRPPFHSNVSLAARPWNDLREEHDDRAFGTLVLSLWPHSGDFARYVLGSDSTGAHAWSSDRDLLAAAVARENGPPPVDANFADMTDVDLESVLAEMQARMPLSEKDGEQDASNELSARHETVQSRFEQVQECYLEPDLVCRWIFKRVLELGWTIEQFGDFDSQIESHGRDAHKPERIGKKYQWIAYHEWLAHVTDQRPYRAAGESIYQYDGTWDIGVRDIDPTCLLRSTSLQSDLSELSAPTWWADIDYGNWMPGLTHEEWMQDADDLPACADLLLSTDPETGKHYVSLNASVTWESPVTPGKQRWDAPFRRIWYILQGYLLQRDDLNTFVEWAAEQNYFGRWMPESPDTYGLYSRDFFWAPAYRNLDRNERNDAALKLNEWYHHYNIPCELVVPTTRYWCESAGFDCSIDDSISFRLPGIHLAEEMQLRPGAKDGTFVEKGGEVVAFDPSVSADGPSTLLFEELELQKFLDQKQYSLVWTILGAKETCIGAFNPGHSTGELQINGVIAFDSGTVRGSLSAHFQTFPIDNASSSRSKVKTWAI